VAGRDPPRGADGAPTARSLSGGFAGVWSIPDTSELRAVVRGRPLTDEPARRKRIRRPSPDDRHRAGVRDAPPPHASAGSISDTGQSCARALLSPWRHCVGRTTRAVALFGQRRNHTIHRQGGVGDTHVRIAPDQEQFHRRTGAAQVVMVSRGDLEANRRKAEEHGLITPAPIGRQKQWEVSREYGMFATPIAYRVSGEGAIAEAVAVGWRRSGGCWRGSKRKGPRARQRGRDAARATSGQVSAAARGRTDGTRGRRQWDRLRLRSVDSRRPYPASRGGWRNEKGASHGASV
jgi:hypothetical protein